MSDSNRAKFNLSAVNGGEVTILDYVASCTCVLVYRYLFLFPYPHFCDFLKVADVRFYLCFVLLAIVAILVAFYFLCNFATI